jgi:hypothetical protein
MLKKRVLVFFALAFSLVQIIYAQEYNVEVVPYVGYTFSGGTDVRPIDIGGGQIANRFTPVSGLSYGFTFDYLVTEGFSLGFNFNEQDSKPKPITRINSR